ncbi:MAG: DUF2244 domain-containing protein [Hyphomonadaceae bacterium]
MTPRWERATSAPEITGPLFMDAELRPHRSLSRAAFKLMLVIVIVVNAAAGAVFALNGAFPVAGFLGLDVLALWLAFRWNYRAAGGAEYVRVGAGQVHIASVGADGAATHWVINPVWARVARDGRGVLIRDGAGQMRVGAFLSPKECESFAAALNAALFRAKRGI